MFRIELKFKPARIAALQGKRSGVKSDGRRRILVLPGNCGVFAGKRIPPVAAVVRKGNRNLLKRTIRESHIQISERLTAGRRPGGSMQQGDGTGLGVWREFDGSPALRNGASHHNGGLSSVSGGIDDIECDVFKMHFALREGTQVVAFPLVTPAAPAVVGNVIGKTEIHSLRNIDRHGPDGFNRDGKVDPAFGEFAG